MQDKKQRQMHLNVILQGAGMHLAAWRHPDARPEQVFSAAHYRRIAQIAEKGKFDSLFFADTLGLIPAEPEVRAQNGIQFYFEPLTLLAYLAAATEKIGLIATVSTSYLEPFHLARQFASLDIISGGRAGWNLVTSSTDYEAKNFGLDLQHQHKERYEKATEYIQVVKGLWDSFEDDAFEADKDSARFFSPGKMHEFSHKGKFYSVKGPLHIQRPVQGYPVLVQAGSSEDGQELAAATADIAFTAQQHLPDAIAFYKGLKARMQRYGRHASELIVLPGVFVLLGKTEQEARERYEALQELIPEASGINLLNWLGIDFSRYHPDDPFPVFPHTEGSHSRQRLLFELAQREKLSIRQVSQRIAGARGHWTIYGTASSVADQLEKWFQEGAADGFNIMPPLLPKGLEEFVEQVIPELQRRGLFRTAYEGNTLRENLGLRRPANQYTIVPDYEQNNKYIP